MNLFELDEASNQVVFAPQVTMIAEFREIWKCDRTKKKETAMMEMAIVYFMADERSDYMYILDLDERLDQIKEDLSCPDWIKPHYMDAAIAKYKSLSQTTSTILLESTRNVVQKISHFLNTIDPNERDQRTNKPVFDINKITGAVEKVPKLIKALNDIEKEIIKEKALKAQSGNKEIGMFDDNNWL